MLIGRKTYGCYKSKLAFDVVRQYRLSVCVCLFITCLGFFNPLEVDAQTDLQLWTEAAFEIEPWEDVEIGTEQNYRFSEDVSEFDRWLTDLRIEYDLSDLFNIGTGYRLIVAPSSDQPCCEHRLHLEGELQYIIGPVRAEMRLRAQVRLSGQRKNKYVVRDRIRMKLIHWNSIRPYVGAELFVRFSDEYLRVDTWRFNLGVDFRIVSNWRVGPYYRIEVPEKEKDDTLHIVGIRTLYAFR